MVVASSEPFAKYVKSTKYFHDQCCPVVYRVVELDGKSYFTTIKTFDTEDAQYNENCAEELIDKLNEQLCYGLPLFKANH
ncbi:MAG: hypothetical protein NC548_36940 [Lachnospiraceae bacterium]|nr:hypothetical protein [Lachnospiraceae bacterium]